MRRWVILNGLLAVIVLGLGVQIVRTWARTLPPIEPRATGKVADAPERSTGGGKRGKRNQADKATQTPLALVTAIVNKDLFDPSRMKATEEMKMQSIAHETAPPPGITLVGVRAFGRDREGFILDTTQGNTQHRIRTGDTVGNFTVKTIRSSSVVLVSQAGDVVTLSLEIDTSKNPAPTAQRPGRAQAAAAVGAGSPAAGVMGTSPSAGIGGTPKPPALAAGTPGAPPPQPPGAVPQPGPAPLPKRGGPPNLPEGVRQKLEQMKGLNKK
jgi:hypothetical protein